MNLLGATSRLKSNTTMPGRAPLAWWVLLVFFVVFCVSGLAAHFYGDENPGNLSKWPKFGMDGYVTAALWGIAAVGLGFDIYTYHPKAGAPSQQQGASPSGPLTG